MEMGELFDVLFWLFVGATAFYGMATLEETQRLVAIGVLATMMILGAIMIPGVLTAMNVVAFLVGGWLGDLAGSKAKKRAKDKGRPKDKRRK
jgi:hypothetical protein